LSKIILTFKKNWLVSNFSSVGLFLSVGKFFLNGCLVVKFIELKTLEDANQVAALFPEVASPSSEIVQSVKHIIDAVRREGDAACRRFTQEFDGVAISSNALEIPADERRQATQLIKPELQNALAQAAENIRFFHEKQRVESWQAERPGVILEERILPIERVGVYIPGGRAKYPSTVLMTAIPAKIAGVEEIVMVSPPDRETGTIDPVLLVAAEIAGVDRIFRLGGAQAVAALAYGTNTIPAVDKIVGPGNAYVAEAKRQVFGRAGIDMLAGPTEVALLVDATAHVSVVVQDMLAQMEHDPVARAVVVSTDTSHLQKIMQQADRQIGRAPREEILRPVWEQNTFFLHAADDETACAAVNALAPEHLQIMTRSPREWLNRIRHAGAVFLGRFSPVAMGDYVAGPNHTLPTNRCARYASPLGVYDFVRHQHIVEYTHEGWSQDYHAASGLAFAERLFNHQLSVLHRLEGEPVTSNQ
jgi:histidinol dehydrogenase